MIYTHTLGFEVIGGKNPKALAISDQSGYMEAPQSPVYDIIVPGFKTAIELAYVPGQVLVVNSNLLNLSCGMASNALVNLPDGLYRITQKIIPYDSLYLYQPYLKISLLRKKYELIIVKLKPCELAASKDIQADMIHLDILMQSAKAEAALFNETKATEKYRLADKLADKLLRTLQYR